MDSVKYNVGSFPPFSFYMTADYRSPTENILGGIRKWPPFAKVTLCVGMTIIVLHSVGKYPSSDALAYGFGSTFGAAIFALPIPLLLRHIFRNQWKNVFPITFSIMFTLMAAISFVGSLLRDYNTLLTR